MKKRNLHRRSHDASEMLGAEAAGKSVPFTDQRLACAKKSKAIKQMIDTRANLVGSFLEDILKTGQP